MKIVKKLTIATIISGLMLSTLFSSGLALSAVGYRAINMGGAFRALADDWSAVYWNPAGLTQIHGKQTGFQASAIIPRMSAQITPYTAEGANGENSIAGTTMNGWTTKEFDLYPLNFVIPANGEKFPRNEKLGLDFGFAVYTPFGLGTRSDAWDFPTNYADEETLDEYREQIISFTEPTNFIHEEPTRFENQSDMKTFCFQPTVAKEISPRLSFGAGFMLVAGILNFNKLNQVANPIMETALGPIIAGGAPYDMIAAHARIHAMGYAVGGNFGLLFKPTDYLSIGLTARTTTPFKSIGGKANITIFGFENEGIRSAIDTTIYKSNQLKDDMIEHIDRYRHFMTGDEYDDEMGEIDSISALLADIRDQMFDGKYYSNEYELDAELPLPTNVGIGFALKPTDKLTTTFDVDYTTWSCWDEIPLHMHGIEEDDYYDDLLFVDKEVESELVMHWKNTVKIAAGFEQKLDNNFAIRGGYWWDQNSGVEETVHISLPGYNPMHSFLFGFSYKFPKLHLLGKDLDGLEAGVVFEHIYVADKRVDWNMIEPEDVDGMLMPENIGADYHTVVNAISFGFHYTH